MRYFARGLRLSALVLCGLCSIACCRTPAPVSVPVLVRCQMPARPREVPVAMIDLAADVAERFGIEAAFDRVNAAALAINLGSLRAWADRVEAACGGDHAPH